MQRTYAMILMSSCIIKGEAGILMREQHKRYDICVIGAGPGGYVAAIYGAQKGKRVALVEKDHIGGTCLNRGCIPTKTFLAAARLRRGLLKSEVFSLEKSGLQVDMGKLVKRKNGIVASLRKSIESLIKSHGVDSYKGSGRIVNSKTVEIGNTGREAGEKILTQAIIIATGSKPGQLPGVIPDGERIITSDHAVDLSSIPKDIIIIGGGVIGIEFSSIFRNMGSKVTVIEMLPSILSTEDREIVATLRRILERSGIEIRTDTKVREVKKDEKKVVVFTENQRGEKAHYEAEKILVAAGRIPYTEGLELEDLGVRTERGFVKVNGKMETNVPGIYAIGDVVGGLMLAHAASQEAIVAVDSILGHPSQIDYRSIPRCIYSIPEAASVGLNEDEAIANKIAVNVGRFPFSANGKAIIEGESEGFFKVIADKEIGQIIGVHVLGENATDLIGSGVISMALEGTIDDIEASVQAHPTLFEAFKEAVLDAKGKAIHLPPKLK